MQLRTRTDLWATSLLVTMGLLPVAACGGKSAGEDDGGTAGVGSAGSGSVPSNGGSTRGGASARGGSEPTAGTEAGGATGQAGSGTAGAVASNPFPCLSAEPLYGDTGYYSCENGGLIRSTQRDCPSSIPRSDPVPNYDPLYDQCQYDGDCMDAPYGHCSRPIGGELSLEAHCQYGCIADTDCDAGTICLCGDPIGYCVQATCTTDADCQPGFHCAMYDPSPGCPSQAFACQTPEDQCIGYMECGEATCTLDQLDGQTRVCSPPQCVIGRPFLVDDVARVAGTTQRCDWLARGLTPDHPPELRQRLVQEWTRAAQLEHASIAAFSRFLLELLAFGAPSELVAETISALEDERRHAEICFALASHYAGQPIGPGPLDVDGALEAPTLSRSLATAVREGCIGETVAALEAAELAAHVVDPGLRDVLERIAADERRHSELAWKFVQWALGQKPALADVLERELVLVRQEIEAYQWLPAEPGAHELARAGVMPEALRAAVRDSGLRQIVERGLAGLIEHARRVRAA